MADAGKIITIEVAGIPDCPNFEPTVRLVTDIAEELGLPVQIDQITVHDEKEAKDRLFPGSPSVLVDGEDLETDSRFRPAAFGCRVYRHNGVTSGVPPAELIRSRLGNAAAGGMPTDRPGGS